MLPRKSEEGFDTSPYVVLAIREALVEGGISNLKVRVEGEGREYSILCTECKKVTRIGFLHMNRVLKLVGTFTVAHLCNRTLSKIRVYKDDKVVTEVEDLKPKNPSVLL